jgi:hypothetical protein
MKIVAGCWNWSPSMRWRTPARKVEFRRRFDQKKLVLIVLPLRVYIYRHKQNMIAVRPHVILGR